MTSGSLGEAADHSREIHARTLPRSQSGRHTEMLMREKIAMEADAALLGREARGETRQ
jgi:hypothetical protein